MRGWARIGSNKFPMVEVTVEEMDCLKAEGDTQIWPVRFDKTKRFHPVLWEYGVWVWFEDDNNNVAPKDDESSGG